MIHFMQSSRNLKLFPQVAQTVLTPFDGYAKLQAVQYCNNDRGAVHHQYSLPEGLRKAVQRRKGSSPKEIEAQDFPGHAVNSRMTVAFAECYAECYQIHPVPPSRRGWTFGLDSDSRCSHRLFSFV